MTTMKASVVLTLKDELTPNAKRAKDAFVPIEQGLKASVDRMKAAAAGLGRHVDSGLRAAGTTTARQFESAWTGSFGRLKAVASDAGSYVAGAFDRANRGGGRLLGQLEEERRRMRAEREHNWRMSPLATARHEYEAAKGGLVPGAVGALGVVGLVEAGNQLLKIKQDMYQAGATSAEVTAAEAKAWEMTARYRNMSATTVMKLQDEARGVFGNQMYATKYVDPFVKAGAFLKAFDGGKHSGGAHGLLAELNAAMKSGEIAGKINPAELAQHVEQLIAMKVALGGNFRIADYLTAQRAAGVSLRSADDEFRYGTFPALVQENGSSAGVMAMTSFNKVVAGVGNRGYAVEAMDQLGLLDRSKKDALRFNKDGKIIGVRDAEGIVGSEQAAKNFPKWVWDTLKPRLDKATTGLSGVDKGVRESQLISKMFPDRNVAKFVTEIIQQEKKLKKNAEQILKVRKDFERYQENSYEFQKQAVWEQLTNITQAIGERVTPIATWLLRKTQQGLGQVSDWIKTNGAAQVGASYALVGAAAASTVGAGLMLLRAGGTLLGIKALASLPTVFGAIGASIYAVKWAFMGLGRLTIVGGILTAGYTIVEHWTTIKARLAAIWGDIKGLWDATWNKGVASPESKAKAEQLGKTMYGVGKDVADWTGASSAYAWINRKLGTELPSRPSSDPYGGHPQGFYDEFGIGAVVPPIVGSSMASEASGAAPAGITVQANGPQVQFNQAPPNVSINVTVNATTNASPSEIGSAVSSQVDSAVRGALHDGAQ